jgi:hypothetical protein
VVSYFLRYFSSTSTEQISFTSIRVVCQNTLFFAIDDIAEHKRRQLKVPHSHRFEPERIKRDLERDHASLMSLYQSAPGQELESAKGTLWGTVNAVSYYVDQVRFGGAGDRLDSAWFGAGARLKNKAWIAACDLLG